MFLFRKAVLVIHGFGGGTWENEFLVNYLQKDSSFDVYAWTIKGHEKDIVDNIKYTEYVPDIEEKLVDLFKDYHTVYVIGHSMGGVIATYLASQYSGIKKLVLLAPAFEYIAIDQNFKDIKDIPKLQTEDDNEHLYDEVLSKMFRVPLNRIIDFTKLVKNYKDKVKNVTIPTLIMHGDIDEIIPLKSSDYAFNNIKAKNKHLVIVKDSRHRILRSNKKEVVSDYIYTFLKGGLKWNKYKKLKEL